MDVLNEECGGPKIWCRRRLRTIFVVDSGCGLLSEHHFAEGATDEKDVCTISDEQRSTTDTNAEGGGAGMGWDYLSHWTVQCEREVTEKMRARLEKLEERNVGKEKCFGRSKPIANLLIALLILDMACANSAFAIWKSSHIMNDDEKREMPLVKIASRCVEMRTNIAPDHVPC